MSWEKKRVLITVKAYPEYSKKHGHVVCTAGLTDDGDWIRLYPMPMNFFQGSSKISKYTWIKVGCKKATDEMLKRKESYKVRANSIKIIDSSSLRSEKDKWIRRNRLILPHVFPSIEYLDEQFKQERVSKYVNGEKSGCDHSYCRIRFFSIIVR